MNFLEPGQKLLTTSYYWGPYEILATHTRRRCARGMWFTSRIGWASSISISARACTAVTPNGIDLIDEHDRRSIGLRLIEEITDAARPNTDEHLNELGS